MAILSDEEVREALAGRRAWRRSGDTLVRERASKDFAEALAFLELIGMAVEDYGRHPDIAITGGNRVRVIVSNPNGAGITEAELRLVAKVDEVADAPLRAPAPRGPLAAVAASSSGDPEEMALVVQDAPPEPEPEPEPEPPRSGRRARIAAALGGLAVGAAALFAARRR